MSVKAVKKGDVVINYDGFQFFSFVNADRVTWMRPDGPGPYKLIQKDIHSVGQNISTKAVGINDRLDLTGEYKEPERTPEERAVFFRAMSKTNEHFAKEYYQQEEFANISLNYNNQDFISLGEPLRAVVHVKNESQSNAYTLKGNLCIMSKNYDGSNEKQLTIHKVDSKIKPEEVLDFKVEAAFAEYENALASMTSFNVVFIAHVVEVDFTAVLSDQYLKIKWPEINIDCGERQVVHAPFEVVLSFKNPLPRSIPAGYFTASCPGILKVTKLCTSETPPGENVTCSSTVRPRSKGKKNLVVAFVSDLLGGRIVGSKEIYVKNV